MSARIFHADLHGLRAEKYAALNTASLDSVPWAELTPAAPAYLFVPQDRTLAGEYEQGWKVTDVFPVNSVGIVTARDALTIHFTKEDAWATVMDFTQRNPEDARQHFRLGDDVEDWKVSLAQADVRSNGPNKAKVAAVYYRPFDVRFTYYTGKSRGFHCRPRPDVMQHLVGQHNVALITSRMTKGEEFAHLQVTRDIVEVICMSSKTSNNGFVFPLYLHPHTGGLDLDVRPNIAPEFMAALGERVGFTPTPEDVFHYIYGVFHAPVFRERYADFLTRDFPRVPLPPDAGAFRAAAAVGARLVALHLLEDPALNDTGVGFPVAGDHAVKKMRPADRYDAVTHRVMLNEREYFENVPPEAWEFRVGGYQPAAKWLDDRSKRTLTDNDITHYRRMIAAMRETVALLPDADAAFALVLAG